MEMVFKAMRLGEISNRVSIDREEGRAKDSDPGAPTLRNKELKMEPEIEQPVRKMAWEPSEKNISWRGEFMNCVKCC